MDLALAHVVGAQARRHTAPQLDPWQMRALTYACRGAKERLLGDGEAKAETPAHRRAEPRLASSSAARSAPS